ncbi:MAG: NUDIX domain-containing protein [Candidatus Diapherotrites archaeon]
MSDKFKVKIIGILFNPKTRRILIGKNKGDKNLSFLEGDLKYNEELDVGLKRITTEKTGYRIHNLGAVYARNKLKGKDELQVFFLCEATEGSKKPGKRVAELKWVRPKEVEKLINEKLPTRLKEYILNLG